MASYSPSSGPWFCTPCKRNTGGGSGQGLRGREGHGEWASVQDCPEAPQGSRSHRWPQAHPTGPSGPESRPWLARSGPGGHAQRQTVYTWSRRRRAKSTISRADVSQAHPDGDRASGAPWHALGPLGADRGAPGSARTGRALSSGSRRKRAGTTIPVPDVSQAHPDGDRASGAPLPALGPLGGDRGACGPPTSPPPGQRRTCTRRADRGRVGGRLRLGKLVWPAP
jgi:hypothetical protein